VTDEEICLWSLKAMGYRQTSDVKPWGSCFYLTGFHNEQAEWWPTDRPLNTLQILMRLGITVSVVGEEVIATKDDIVVMESPSQKDRASDSTWTAISVAVAKVAAILGQRKNAIDSR